MRSDDADRLAIDGGVPVRWLFAAVARSKKPVLIHNEGTDWPEAVVALAREHPEVPIIAAHAGYGDAPHPTHDAAWRLAAAPNIWLEFCSTYLAVGAIRQGIEAIDAERMLFGSDYPLTLLGYMRAEYVDAGLNHEESELILYSNAW